MATSEAPHVGKRIKALCDLRDISVNALARAIGAKKTRIDNILRGLVSPTDAELRKIADFLKGSELWLKTCEGDPLGGSQQRGLDHGLDYHFSLRISEDRYCGMTDAQIRETRLLLAECAPRPPKAERAAETERSASAGPTM